MSNIDNVEFCELWMAAVAPIADLEYQRRVWFRNEGEEVDSFEDAIEAILDVADRNLNATQGSLNQKCYSLIQDLTVKIDQYRHSSAYVNGASEEKPVVDSKWLCIIKLARTTYNALEAFKQEIADVEERSI